MAASVICNGSFCEDTRNIEFSRKQTQSPGGVLFNSLNAKVAII